MSFASFYTLRIELSDPSSARYEKIRIKTAKHPLETNEHMAARFLAYAYSYKKGLEFSGGLFEPGEPSILNKDITGDWLTWIYVGVPHKKSLESILRDKSCKEKRIYLYADEQKEELRYLIASHKTHVDFPIEIYFIEPKKLALLAEQEATSAEWKVTLVDDQAFVNCGDFDVDLEICKIEIDKYGSQAVA